MLIDAHTHICAQVSGRIAAGRTQGIGYGRVSSGDEIIQAWPPLCPDTKHTPEMLVAHMDWVGIDKAVLLQGPFYGDCNDYVRGAVRRFPERFIGTAYLDPWSGTPRDAVEAILHTKELRAIKLECSEKTGLCGIHPQARLDDPGMEWLWQKLGSAGFVLVLDLGKPGSRSYQTEAVRDIARRHQNLRIIIAHLGQPGPELEQDPARRRLWEEQIALATMPNIWFDTAALPAYFPREVYPFPSAGRYLRAAIEKAGPQRFLWGTDVPGLLAQATYKQLLDVAQHHLEFLSSEDRAAVMGQNAKTVYGK